jgi:hypothetical protein
MPRRSALSPRGKGLSWPAWKREGRAPSPAGGDSGLEAFSRNPADGGLPPPAFRPSGLADRPNRLFLSYWVGLPCR